MSCYRTQRVFLFVLLFYFVAVGARAEDDFSQGVIEKNVAIAAAKAADVAHYPNSDTVLVDKYVHVRYQSDGTYVQWDDNYTKILTEKGKRQWQTIRSWYNTVYNTTAFALVEIIRPDGTVVAVDFEKRSRDFADPSDLAKNIVNPKSRILEVGVPNLQIGDMIHYVMVDHFIKSRVRDTFSDYMVFESTRPIVHQVYEVFGPTDKPLQSIALKSEVKGTVTYTAGEKEGWRQYRWEVKDVPRLFPEPSMPPVHTVAQRLIVSTVSDWKEISRWYWTLSEPHFKTTPAMQEQVAAITKGVNDSQKKIEAVFQWVSQKVRYAGITVEDESPGYEPHDVAMTFENRHGVCRDKAALLVAMLREAGFEAFPVLIHNGPKKDAEVPTPYFNHAIACARNADGSYQLMDPTDENTKQLFPAYLGNQSYLVATPGGETLKTSPVVPAGKNLMRIETTGRIDAKGTLRGESVLTFNGINDNAYRGYFSRVKPELRRRLFEGRIKDAVAGARLTGYELQPADMRDTSQTMTVRLRFEAEDVLIRNERVVMLPLLRLGTGIGMVNFILGKTGLAKRKYPLLTEIACGVRETFDIELDASIGAPGSVPRYEPVETDTVTLKTEAGFVPGEGDALRLQGRSDFLLKAVEWTPEQYLGLKETLKKVEYDRRKMPVLLASAAAAADVTDGSDVLVLESRVEYDLADAKTWTETRSVKKKILTQAGQKQNSELRFEYNPVWETVTVDFARTVMPDGTIKEISQDEINEVDQAWVGAAPRYPAGKILVANIPGVAVGATIEYRVKRTYKNQPFFAMQEYFRGFDPLQAKTVVWRGPNRSVCALLPDTTGRVQVAKQTDGKLLEYSWTIRDVEAVKREDSLPPWHSFNPSIFLSTGSWRDYARAVYGVLHENATRQASVEAKTKDLIAGIENEEGRIRAIRNFIAKNIRLAGPSLNAIPLSVLTPADKCLEDGYGNAADRASLVYAMLRVAGFRPEFVLASNASKVDLLQEAMRDCPDTSWLSAVLVRVKQDGGYVYLNDTNQYDALGVAPRDKRLALGLPGGQFETIAALKGKRDHSVVHYIIALEDSGAALIKRTEHVYGSGYGAMKKMFAELPPEERSRWHQEAVARISQAAKAEGALLANFEAYPGVIEYTVSLPTFAVPDGDYYYLTLPETLRNLIRLRGDERENPLYRAQEERVEVSYAILPPPGYTVAELLPPSMERVVPEAGIEKIDCSAFSSVDVQRMGMVPAGMSGSFMEQLKHVGSYLHLEYKASLAPAVIPADRYNEMLDLYRQLSHSRMRTVLLKRVALKK